MTDIGGKIFYKYLHNQFAAPYMSKAIEPESIELVNIWTNEPYKFRTGEPLNHRVDNVKT